MRISAGLLHMGSQMHQRATFRSMKTVSKRVVFEGFHTLQGHYRKVSVVTILGTHSEHGAPNRPLGGNTI
jgi:hypothetical protein